MNIEITQEYKASLVPLPAELLEPLHLPEETFEFLKDVGLPLHSVSRTLHEQQKERYFPIYKEPSRNFLTVQRMLLIPLYSTETSSPSPAVTVTSQPKSGQ